MKTIGKAGLRTCQAAALVVATTLQIASASDRPLPPAEMTVKAVGPTVVTLSFASVGKHAVRFEFEQTVDGVRVDRAAEAALSLRIGPNLFHTPAGLVEERIKNYAVTGLVPQTRYCFRAYARVISTDLRSAAPSPWGCAVTPPYAPHPPLDVAAVLDGVTDTTPRLSWNTPDQSGDRPIDRYVVQRQSPVGPGRPWIDDRVVAGPRGAQTAATRLAFTVEATAIKTADKHAYRVCSENAGGRSCSGVVEVAATVHRALQGASPTPPKAAAQRPAASARTQPNTPIQAPATAAKSANAAARTAPVPAAPSVHADAPSASQTASAGTAPRTTAPVNANAWGSSPQTPLAAPRPPVTRTFSPRTAGPAPPAAAPASALAR